MIKELGHIDESNKPVTNKDFKQVLMMLTTICQFLFEEYDGRIGLSRKTNKYEMLTRTCDTMTMSLALATIWKNRREP